MACGFHLLLDESGDDLELLIWNLENKFVMNLQNHSGAERAGNESIVDGNHGELDDVGCSSLNWGIYGVSFRHATDDAVARRDVTANSDAYRKAF